jgi:acyl-CoA synthetase (NDP forming)
MKDVSFRVAPFSLEDAKAMINEVKAIKLLKGVRGQAPSDIETLAETVLKISQMAVDYPEIQELDLNPLMVFEAGQGAVAVDARFIL